MKKTIWLLIAGISLTLGLQVTDAQTKRKVVFGVPVTPPNVVHLPPYVAKEMGFFDELNIDVELVTFEGGTQTLRGSVAGGLDITGTSSDPAIIAAARGAGTKVLGTYSHKLSQSMLVQGDIKSCKDLKGRKIGIQEVGAFNEVMSRAVMASCGLTPKDVEYVPVSTKGRVAGLLSGQIDTAILHVDQAIVAKKKKADLNLLVNLWEPLPKWLYAAYIAPEKEQKLKEGKKMKKYRCTVCGYIYDPAMGDPDSGVAPGTPFESIPDDWVCPVCGVDKTMFEEEA